jgi:DnaJ family protein B protein 4
MLLVLSLFSALCFVHSFDFTAFNLVDPYQVLGLKKSFKSRDLRRVFRRYLLEKTRNATPTPLRQRQFAEIDFSLTLLSNPSAKKLYDSVGLDFLNNTAFMVTGFSSDIQLAVTQQTYGQIPPEMTESGGTVYFPIEFQLADFYRGATRTVYLSGISQCVCKKSKTQRCRKCRQQPFIDQIQTQKVTLPPGAPPFFPILAANAYDLGVPRAAHDIVFIPIAADAPGFARVGHDLWVNQTIQLSEVIRGRDAEVVTLDGEIVKVGFDATLKEGGIVRVLGKGFPVFGQEASGDLVIVFDVVFPETLDEQQKKELAVILPDDEEAYG